MLNFRLSRFKHGDSVRRLHTKYGTLNQFFLPLLWRLYLEDIPSGESTGFLPILRQLFPEDRQPQWLRERLPEEARLTLMAYRGGALYFYIEAAALRVEGRRKQPRIRANLQVLGGRLARLKGRGGPEEERNAIAGEIENLRVELRRIPQWPKLIDPQLWWHWAMAHAYECLPRPRGGRTPTRVDVKHLCEWLSVPEIGLRCTAATIKAARRRFASREWFGRKLPTYLATPRGSVPRATLADDPGVLQSQQAVPDKVLFTCLVCDRRWVGDLLDIGTHLETKHGADLTAVDIPEGQTEIRWKGTEKVIVSWKNA